MRVLIETDSQEEFDEKRPELIKALAGSSLYVEIVKSNQKQPLEPRGPFYRSEEQMLQYWDNKFKTMLNDIKKEVEEVIDGE